MEKGLTDVLWVTVCAGLVFLMQAGFLCLETGLTRSKNNINVAIKNLSDLGISISLFWAFGFALMFGRSYGGWIGSSGFMLDLAEVGMWSVAFLLYEAMFCGTAVTILSGAIAERMRFGGYLVVAVLVSGVVYPVFGHWVWNGANEGLRTGWLNSMGFVDFAGATAVHSFGGWVSLALLIGLGARTGRFPKDGPPQNVPGANLPIATLGVILLWLGWFGFNGGSTLAMDSHVPRVITNTIVAGAVGLVIALALGWFTRGHADVYLVINGSLAGLVAITGAANSVSTLSSALIGGGGSVAMLLVDRLLVRWRIDDAVGAVPVHLGAGIWGTLTVALLADAEIIGTGLGTWAQLKVQVLGIVVCGLWTFTTVYLVFSLINRWHPLRVTREEEHVGLNVSEHGATTELLDLFTVMDQQSRSGDLSLRVPVEPFTEIGQIATHYNRSMESLEKSVASTEGIVESAMDGILTLSKDALDLLSVNPAAERMFARDGSRLLGRSISHLIGQKTQPDQNQLPSVRTLIEEIANADGRFELVGKSDDGRTFPMEVSVSEVTAAGTALYVVTCRDVSAREQAQKELRESEDRYRNLVDNITIGLFRSMPGAGGRILMANPAVVDMFGYSSVAEFMETTVSDHFVYTKDIGSLVNRLVEEGEVKGAEARLQRRDGSTLWAAVNAKAVHDEDGKLVHFDGMIQDISVRKEAEIAMLQAKDEAEAASRAKSEFLANMSHELRTPLNAILGHSQILVKEESLEEREKRRVSTIQRSGEHLLDLINDILDMSKIEAGRLELELREFSLPDLLEDVSRVFEARAQQVGLSFSYQAFAELPVGVRSDDKKLRQVLINLLGNAVKFTEEGGVLLSVGRSGHNLRFEVKDTGVGIARESLEDIFEAFEHVSADGHAEGTGLGLPISRRLVEMLGGELKVESELGKGSRFWFELELEEAAGLAAASDQQERRVTAYAGSPRKVLVVDDKTENRQVLVDFLVPLGFEVREAADGHDGVDQALAWRPDLLLMDLRMPGLGGLEAIERVRHQLDGAPMVVVVVTASAFETDRQLSIDAGADDFLAKPFREATLMNMLQFHLGLEWEYAEDTDSPVGEEVIFPSPPAVELASFVEPAKAGNLLEIRQQAEILMQTEPRYAEFGRHLVQLTKEFKVEQIQRLIAAAK